MREKLGRRAGFLSGAQQQMLSIACAHAQAAAITFRWASLDLDSKTQQLIFATIKEISKQGTTILMVEQNAHQALRICAKAYMIENGKVAMSAGRSLAKQKKVQSLYLGGE